MKKSAYKNYTNNNNNNNANVRPNTAHSVYGGIDFTSLEKDLRDNFDRFKSSEKKDIVLVIGPTRSGKGTLINYMLGYNLVSKLYNVSTVYEVDQSDKKTQVVSGNRNVSICYDQNGSVIADIDHGAASATLFTQTFVTSNAGREICFCDTPGFEDNGNNESRILSSLSLEYAIKAASSISSIVVVINLKELSVQGGILYTKLAIIIGKIIKNNEKVKDSLVIVFSHADQDQKKGNPAAEGHIDLTTGLCAQLDAVSQVVKDAVGDDTSKAINAHLVEKATELFKYVIEKKRYLIQYSFKDDKDRKLLFGLINNIKCPAPKDRFNFLESYEEVRNNFNNWVAEIIKTFIRLQQDIADLSNAILNIDSELSLKSTEIESYKMQIDTCDRIINGSQAEIDRITENQKNIPLLQEKICKAKEKINAKNEEKESANTNKNNESLNNKIEAIEIQINNLKKSKRHVKGFIREDRITGSMFKQVSCHIAYFDEPYGKAEIVGGVEKYFEIKEDSPKKGRYHAIYTIPASWSTETHMPAVQFYIAEKDHYDTKEKINELEEEKRKLKLQLKNDGANVDGEMVDLRNLCNDYELELGRINNKINTLPINKQNKTEAERTKDEINMERTHLSNYVILTLRNERKKNQTILDRKKDEINSQQETYQIICLLSLKLDFPPQLSLELERFRSHYDVEEIQESNVSYFHSSFFKKKWNN